MDMDMDWTDLGLSDVEPEDLKGFPTVAGLEEQGPGDDEEWDAHWARMDGDDERADDLDWDAEWARMDADDDELDEVQTLPREIKDRKPTKPDLSDIEYETCSDCGVKGGHENDCPTLAALYNEDLNEEQSEFRLKDIVGADNFAELVSDMNTGGIDYSAAYFTPLYWHFLDEYPDEIPVGSRTGRPEDPEQYVLDNLDRYHSEEIKSYMNTPDMDESNCGVCGETFKWEGSPDEEMCPRCTQEYLGEEDGDVPSRRVSDEELLAKVEGKINDALKAIAMGLKAEKVGESKVLAIQLRRDLKELKAFIESGGDALGLRAKLHLAFVKAEKLADYSYEYDDVLWELNDADNLLYLHLSGRPVAIDEEGTDGKRIDYPESWEEKFHRIAKDQHERELYNICADDEMNALLQGELEEASCPCGKEGCECGPDCDCEPVEEGFSLDSIVESLLDERGQPKDYEMSDDELTAEIEDETSEFERDHIDKEIEDEELGLRFD
jgi:hypothetical protein